MDTKYNPKNIEEKWYDYWLNNNFFRSIPDKRTPYTILIPPPNVTGVLHMGHMLNNTIQDILIRRARLLGLNACWIPGTDHASIATEAKVLKKLKDEGIDKSMLSREEFLHHAWEWTDKHGGIILEQLKRLGVSCDWSRLKFTMDPDMSSSVTKVFIDLYNKGFIYRGYKMINWDPKAKTAISDEEVIYKEQDSNLYYIDYKIKNSKEVITIATTRPETILGDTAVCVHPEDVRYQHIIGKKVLVPLINREIPIVSDNYIDPEFGTGVLKVTPAHDINDYMIGEKYGLELISVIDESGLISSNGQLYVGEDRFVVRKKIINDIKNLQQLNRVEIIKNKVGFSERTDVVVEPRLSNQWFMKMDKMAKPALDNVLNGNINFYPSKIINSYKYWMENIRDWCLSRQLWWGHRIPVFYYGNSNFVVAENKKEALLIAQKESENKNLTLSDLKQDQDVLDTWFSSWLWPLSVLDGIRDPKNKDFQYYYPTNDLVTGPDILFFWVARMIMAGYELQNNLPFKNVYFTGIVRDHKRRKMSKSLGNSPDPIELIDKYGADGVRSAMLFTSPAGNDLLFDEMLCEQGRNFSNKIWNAFRLIKSWKDVKKEMSSVEKTTIDWFDSVFMLKLNHLDKLFKEFKISECLMLLYKLIWDDFCGSYLEIIKPIDKTISNKTYDKTIFFFNQLLICLHPFMPFITEEIWSHLNKDVTSISFSKWPTSNTELIDENILSDFIHLFEVVASIRKIRIDQKIPFKTSLEFFFEKKHNIKFQQILKKMCNLSSIQLIEEEETHQYFSFLVDVHKYYIPKSFSLDLRVEIKKVEDSIDYLTGFLFSIEKKINNQNFISNAPDQVIQMELKKQSDTKNKLASLKQQLKQFHQNLKEDDIRK